MQKTAHTTRLLVHNLLVLFTSAIFSFSGCSKQNDPVPDSSAFLLTCDSLSADSMFPTRYTCDGEGISPPLNWSGYPAATRLFALVMHHVASPTDVHWYWVVYNIPVSTHSVAENARGFGFFGNNSVNGKLEYSPPCSQGPGRKNYILTIYALSDTVYPAASAGSVNRQVLLEAIRGIVIDSSTLQVWYSRQEIKQN